MKFIKIKVKNFKSYTDLEIDFNKLNYIIGGNASGKSNFVNILKFFNDIIYYGLDDAVLLQGGIKYIFNANSEKDSNIVLEYELDFEDEKNRTFDIFSDIVEQKMYLPRKMYYVLEIKPNGNGNGYKIRNEKLEITVDEMLKKKKGKKSNSNRKKSYDIFIKRGPDKNVIDNFDEFKLGEIDSLFNIDRAIQIAKRDDDLLIRSFIVSFGLLFRYDTKIKIFNFDVNLLKSPSNIAARGELEEDGSNLVNVIQQLLKNKSNKEKLKLILKTVLPFIDDITVENSFNKSLFFKVKESYNKNEFPSSMLSDGTVNILALIVALYFQDDNEIIVLEEPERNIHPKMLKNIVTFLEEVSSNKQIFVTTHNPYIVKYANLDDVILVSRNENGISCAARPSNDNNVKQFLKSDLGIEDLFVDGVL